MKCNHHGRGLAISVEVLVLYEIDKDPLFNGAIQHTRLQRLLVNWICTVNPEKKNNTMCLLKQKASKCFLNDMSLIVSIFSITGSRIHNLIALQLIYPPQTGQQIGNGWNGSPRRISGKFNARESVQFSLIQNNFYEYRILVLFMFEFYYYRQCEFSVNIGHY